MPTRQSATDRRNFLSRVSSAAVVVIAGTGCATPLAAGAQAIAATPSSKKFDDSWTRRVIAAKHKAVFDSPGVDDGLALGQAIAYMDGYKEMFGASDDDVVPVVVMRHLGTVMALSDAMWDKYELGEKAKVKDPVTKAMARRNPFIHVEKGDKKALVESDSTLEALRARGVVLLACNRAAMHFADQIAEKSKRDVEEVRAEIRANVVPGVLLQPSGLYATTRAQEAGCAFIKST